MDNGPPCAIMAAGVLLMAKKTSKKITKKAVRKTAKKTMKAAAKKAKGLPGSVLSKAVKRAARKKKGPGVRPPPRKFG